MGVKINLSNRNIVLSILFLFLFFVFCFFCYLGVEDQKIVLISFDVEPVDGREAVLNVLDILDEQELNATFFITGEYVKQNPGVVLQINKKYEVACHSNTHPNFLRLDNLAIINELKGCLKIIHNLTGQSPKGFRAPYHLINQETLEVLIDFNFLYDASYIQNYNFFYPSKNKDLLEIPLTSFMFFPMEDVVWLYYFDSPKIYFFLLNQRKKAVMSFNFHPHHIVSESRRFSSFINKKKSENVKFISHRDFAILDNDWKGG